MRNSIRIFFVSLIALSCKKKEVIKNVNSFDDKPVQLVKGSATLEKKNIEEESILENTSQKKALLTRFYLNLFGSNTVSTFEFNQIFGSVFNAGENYLKQKYSKLDCLEVSYDCNSYIFSKMREKLNKIAFNHSKDQVINAIQNSKNEEFIGNSYRLRFVNSDDFVDLYFFQDKNINQIFIDDIVANSNYFFLAEFEE